MSRGERSRPERTVEERERDRLERERRRAEREGRPLPDPGAAPLAEGVAEGADPHAEGWIDPEPPHAEPTDASLPEQDPGFELDPHVPHADSGLIETGHADPAAAPPSAGEPSATGAGPFADPELADPAFGEPSPEVGADPFADPAFEGASAGPFADPASGGTPGDMSHGASVEPFADPAFAGTPGDVSPGTSAEPFAEPELVDPVGATPPPPSEPPDLPAGEDPHPPEPLADDGRGLPPPPPRVRSEPPMRRAFRRRAAPPAAGVALAGGRERSRVRGGFGSRIAALIALIAVAIAVILVVHSLKGSSHTNTPRAIPVVKVLIPEGKTRLQIAQIAAADGLKGDYRSAARSSDLLDPTQYGAPKGTPDLEGFLFPATYEVDRGAPVSRLVEEQLTAFGENFGAEDVSRAKALGVTPYQLLTVASLVEREAQVPGDRAKIAAVIYNRLKAGMPIGIDAAIYYAVEISRNIPTYTQELTEAQLHMNSPYNTRTHTGLPPTPISNPGVASIEAAAHPAHAAYLYYVAGADGCGEQVFSNTQSEFETDVAAYEAAKQKNGGHPPVCKHAG